MLSMVCPSSGIEHEGAGVKKQNAGPTDANGIVILPQHLYVARAVSQTLFAAEHAVQDPPTRSRRLLFTKVCNFPAYNGCPD